MAQNKARRITFDATFTCASPADAELIKVEAEHAFDGRVGKVNEVIKRGKVVKATLTYGYTLGGWNSDLDKVCVKIIEGSDTEGDVEYEFEQTKVLNMDREKFDEKREAADGNWPKRNAKRVRDEE